MPEERKTIGARLSASPEVYHMARFEKAFPWLLAGGAALVLLETYRKNANDRAKANADIKAALKNQEHQAEVLKERKAERRERYTTAVEQLGNASAPVRMGGVYTLIGLADEWLLDENLDYTEKVREGQVIVNNLCAYIRSPFTLASYHDELSEDKPSSEGIYKDNQQKFYTDKAEFKSEADIRLSIIKEIHNRLQNPEINTPGTWSDFEYDFSGSTFFYPIDLTNSYYKKPVNFSGSTYQSWADFSDSTYKDEADFSDSTYQSWADFARSTYQGWADFSGSTYRGRADFDSSIYKSWATFDGSTYNKQVNFSGSTYHGLINFNNSTYQGIADFNNSIYEGGADFNNSIYEGGADFGGSTYQGEADFGGSTYQGEADFTDSTYQGEADFTDSTYQGRAHFSRSIYKSWADFSRSIYKSWAHFTDSTYKSWAHFSDSTYENETDFSGSIFYQETYFGEDGYGKSSSCFTNHAPQFYDKKNRKNTLFGSHNNDFTVDIDKGYPIDLDSEGIPLNCKFLTSEQKGYLADKFQEIEKINNELREIKDPKEKAELSRRLQALNKELYEWWEEATTVKMESTAPREEDN